MKDRPLITPGAALEGRKFRNAMLPEMGDSCVGLLTQMGVPSPGIVLVAIDLDTGEVASTTNLEQEDMVNVMREMVALHDAGDVESEERSVQ